MIYLLLVAHFVGDFICQSDWMATNKSKRFEALGFHVLVYSFVLLGIMGLGMWLLLDMGGQPVRPLISFILINAAAHLATDAVTSQLTSKFWFFRREEGIWVQAEYSVPKHWKTLINPWTPIDGKRHWFFVLIGLDQLIHYVTLVATAEWLL